MPKTLTAKKLKVAVIGATGYSGEMLIRILVSHPKVCLTYVSAREERNQKIQEIFPYLQGLIDLPCPPLNVEEAKDKADLFFLSLPHTASMEVAPLLLKAQKRVIDISADYRLKDPRQYHRYYHVEHKDTAHLKEAVYGLPEIYRSQIVKARLIANPGCYPTSVILGLLPALSKGLIRTERIIADSKSGVTGAGRSSSKRLHFSEVNENFYAYKPLVHQHVPEIEQELKEISGEALSLTFVPHLLPLNQGILTTHYVELKRPQSGADLLRVYKDFYRKEPFVQVYSEGFLPQIKDVVGTNRCAIGIQGDASKRMAVIVSVIDNLIKGASGQAVQNMNLMAGFSETDGLR